MKRSHPSGPDRSLDQDHPVNDEEEEDHGDQLEHQQPRFRVILLLDLDCFYAQCECRRLGWDATVTPLALLQWNSTLAVTYPARKLYGIQRGDSWPVVHEKSRGQCYTVHVPVLAATTTTTGTTTSTSTHDNTDVNSTTKIGTKSHEAGPEGDDGVDDAELDGEDSDPTSLSSLSLIQNHLEQSYESIFLQTPEQQEAARQRDVGRRHHAHQGKACIQRYRVASARIFRTVQEWLEQQPNGRHIILERASIDEFFLDVTAACRLYNSASSDDPASAWPAWEETKTVVVESPSEIVHPDVSHSPPSWRSTNDQQLQMGCRLAFALRKAIGDQLGFTLTAGVSVNKTLAKLTASYGKPNGQAVTLEGSITYLLEQTQISKCRNLGGKLGRQVQALLPEGVPTTVGSIATYLPLPQLQQALGGAETALWVYRAARGIDLEAVAPKNATAATKSITAFKSLPFQLSGYSLSEAASWIRLLAEEIVTRVEQDQRQNARYPRSCSVHYAPPGQARSQRFHNKSVRIAFPSQTWPNERRVAELCQRVPRALYNKEGAGFRITRIGLCAAEFVSQERVPNALDQYFASDRSRTVQSGEEKPTAPENQDGTDAKKSSGSMGPREDRAIRAPQASFQETTPAATTTSAPLAAEAKEVMDGDEDDADLIMAKRLQAAYDRECQVLQELEQKERTRERKPPTHNKTRRIDSFFSGASKSTRHHA